jgi:hypothetical protein
MSEKTKQLIAKFLEENFDDFSLFLDVNDIEPTEAEVIIEEVRR